MVSYYNEFDPYAAQWLRNLITAGHIAPGDVDTRSIVDVVPSDLAGYTQCHFFAGIGGWSYAARLAGWPDNRPLWTGSCPCQPFSVAGKQEGQSDERHLWPIFFNLIRARRPDVVMGEQVAAAVGKHWLDGVFADLENVGYAGRAVVVPACAVDAPHRRDRLWFVADRASVGSPERHAREVQGFAVAERQTVQPERCRGHDVDVANPDRVSSGQVDPLAGGCVDRGAAGQVARSSGAGDGHVAHSEHGGREGRDQDGRFGWSGAVVPSGQVHVADADQLGESQGWEQRGGQLGRTGSNSRGSAWVGASWLPGADGKARRVEPGIRLLAHGVPARVGKLRAYGNAIVPQVAAEILGAYLDTERLRLTTPAGVFA